MTTEITIQQRAIVAIGGRQYETDLRELAAKSADIVSITNKAGLDQCHVSRMSLKRERIEIGKKARSATEDAKLFVAAVSARAKSLVDLLQPEESRLGELQESYVAEQDRIKREAAQREQERVQRITGEIDIIRGYPVAAATSSIEDCERLMQELCELVIGNIFAEFKGRAAAALADAKAGVASILSAKVAAAEEAARIKAEQEAAAAAHAAEVAEFERRKAEADEQRRKDRAKAKAEQDERDRVASEDRKEEHDRIAVERAKLSEAQAKFDAERAAILAGIEAERQRVAAEEAKAAAIKKAEEDAIAAQQAEEKRNADEAEAARHAATSAIRKRIDEALDRLGDYELGMVADYVEAFKSVPA